MKILLAADVHAAKWRQFATVTGGQNSRLAVTLDALRQLRKHAAAVEAAYIIIIGDLFEKRGVIDVDVFNAVSDVLAEPTPWKGEWLLDVGNHDQATKDGKVHSLYTLRHLPNVLVFSEPTRFVLADDTILRIIPFHDVGHIEQLRAWLKEDRKLPRGGLTVIHQGIIGSHTPHGYSPREELALADLRACGVVFAGHYHTRQRLSQGEQFIGYVGCLLPQQFGDCAPGFVEFATKSWEFQRFKIHAPSFVVARRAAPATVKGNYVSYLLRPGESRDEIAERLKVEGAVAVDFKPYPLETDVRERKTGELASVVDLPEVVEQYAKGCDEPTQRLGQELLQQAKELEEV